MNSRVAVSASLARNMQRGTSLIFLAIEALRRYRPSYVAASVHVIPSRTQYEEQRQTRREANKKTCATRSVSKLSSNYFRSRKKLLVQPKTKNTLPNGR